jgi:hypothetical protein
MSRHSCDRLAGAERQSPVAIDEAPRSLLLGLTIATAIFLLVTGVAMTTAAVASYVWALL